MADIEMIPTPGSTQVASAGYDGDSKVLRVEFVSGGVYEYDGVPDGVLGKLVNAPSVGQFFNAAVKNAYSYRRIS